MHYAAPSLPADGTPLRDPGRRALEDARRLFRRTLSSWVCDLLSLRQGGRHRPGWGGKPADDERDVA